MAEEQPKATNFSLTSVICLVAIAAIVFGMGGYWIASQRNLQAENEASCSSTLPDEPALSADE
ncbi:MAG: hypothetical protein OEV37_02105 [Candidatus Berkelbacteria bacterium]|nr:hypothetical protein [Candidatus Berkelbacteria bacterium]